MRSFDQNKIANAVDDRNKEFKAMRLNKTVIIRMILGRELSVNYNTK